MSQQPRKKRNKKMTKKLVSNSPVAVDQGTNFGPINQSFNQRNTRAIRIHIPRKPSGK
ncbi:hypothetical protein KC721_00015 [Candidatus Woesebacteria bacterium]|nr:hypothetical protein [Candidatus Woesebacteria bacterium]